MSIAYEHRFVRRARSSLLAVNLITAGSFRTFASSRSCVGAYPTDSVQIQAIMASSNTAAAGDAPALVKPRNRANLEAYRALGNELPTCVNPGCNRFVAVRHWNDGLIPSLKTECTTCSTARKKGKALPGITCVKKHTCENSDGRLGFSCPCDSTRYAELPSDCYHMDHMNGNHSDNRPENIMTLCMLCHTIKGKRDGDFNGSKPSSLRFG